MARGVEHKEWQHISIDATLCGAVRMQDRRLLCPQRLRLYIDAWATCQLPPGAKDCAGEGGGGASASPHGQPANFPPPPHARPGASMGGGGGRRTLTAAVEATSAKLVVRT